MCPYLTIDDAETRVMTEPTGAKKAALAALWRKYGAHRLDAFGSVTTDAFDPATSDLDADFAARSPG